MSKRNAAVLQYNSTLSQIGQYRASLASLETQASEITRDEYEKLDLDHPSLTAFLDRVYRDMIRTAQLWLARAQQAFKFLSLEDVNVIGSRSDGHSLSQSGTDFLTSARLDLVQRHTEYLESKNLVAQSAEAVQYPLSPNTIKLLRQADTSITLDIAIDPDDQVFSRMYDVRLKAVRFFAPGVRTDNGELRVYLTHAGDEVIVNSSRRQIRFHHDPLTVTFWSKLASNSTQPVIANGSIGLDMDETYERVGPFTHWRIELTRNEGINPGLDLKDVESAFLEFDLTFRTFTQGR